jgi:putative transposase
MGEHARPSGDTCMARRPRLDLPQIPQHVVQRGNNRQACFVDDADRVRYLHDLRAIARHHRCAVHAYVLMGNHVHLLLTPSETGCVPALMHSIGTVYVRAFNARHGRTGTLWEGRYKSNPVDSGTYLLRCYRYIELNPVRAHLASRPGDYRWSSYHANALGQDDPLVSPHPEFIGLARDAATRHATYRELVDEVVSTDEQELIRLRLRHQHALGGDDFRAMLEARSGLCAGPLPVGRPRRREAVPGPERVPPGLLGPGGEVLRNK